MKRRAFLNACVGVLGSSLLYPTLFLGPAARPATLPAAGAREWPCVKVFGPGALDLELVDYSGRYAPDGARRSVQNILISQLIPGCSISRGWDKGGGQWVRIDGKPVDVSAFAPELLERLDSYVSDADVLIGTVDLGDPNRKPVRLLKAAARLSRKRTQLRLALAIFPFAVYGESYRVCALAELETLKAGYHAVAVLPMDLVLEAREPMTLEHAYAAVDRLCDRALAALVDSALHRAPGSREHCLSSLGGKHA